MLEDASDIFAAVAKLKSLAGGGALPIITPMSKPVKRQPRDVIVAAARQVDPAKIREVDEGSYIVSAPAAPGWRKPAPPAPPTETWTTGDLRNWRERTGLTQVEAARHLGVSSNGYSKLELGLRKLRLGHVRLCRYIEAYGPLP